MAHAIRVHEIGGPEVLRWEEIETADPGPDQVLLRQEAVGLNFIDVYHRTGLYPQPLPFTPGTEGAGTVEKVGSDVTHVKVGDRVAYAGPLGGYAEQRLIDADRLVKLPDDISAEQAAGMMLQGMTAQMLLRSVFPVAKGDTILIHAAAGGVGLILCQWASAIGATVIGTVGTEEKAELARAHGCAHPVIYSRQDFVVEVQRITDGEKLPVVYDSVGRDTFMRSLDCLKVRGLMVSFGQSSGSVDAFSPNLLAQKGSLYLTRPTLFHYIASRQQLEQSAKELFAVVSSGKVKIEVQQRFPLRDAAEAHRALQARKTTGSTILTI
ncbi:quinone oxidoreductase family protein [Sphingomonas hankyongi]|uniref:Quinone oxidoreductase n=1 Tax=Sphingomonas hankyongi TaxID=2908209 RepID=A0ABT0S3B1_9SPHN|nr:quinone oxidoreductase [Sphingomonas hankyongi]MCL6730086.1 quinone oxidoreductase [Sphingomonas hankyongi]